jgi:hypothetical protein
MVEVIENSGYIVREANENDFSEIADLNAKHNFGMKKEDWLRWKYLENPGGKGRLFLLIDPDDNINGTLGFLPVTFSKDDKTKIQIMEMVDGFLAPKVRGKKLFQEIICYALERIKGPVIGFPNELAEPVCLKCDFQIFSPMDVWYFPVDHSSIIPEKYRMPLRPLSVITSWVYTWIFLGSHNEKIKMRAVNHYIRGYYDKKGFFKKEISSDFLNWRFISNPTRSYQCYEFINHRRSIGYCVFTIEGSSLELIDFVTMKNKSCLRKLVEYCRKKHLTHIAFPGVGIKANRLGFIKSSGNKRNVISYNLTYSGNGAVKLRDSDW